ncbi:unnamed protein product, partial [Clonostachys chloroleuca]
MTLYVPGLGRLLQDWPRGTNPNIEAARAEVEKLHEITIEAPEKLIKLRKCDFGLPAALCYPTCPRAGLYPYMAHSSSAGPNAMKIFDLLSEQLRINMSNDTSAIGPGLAICELTAEVMLPEWVTQSVEMGCMWKSISVICMFVTA